MPNSSNSLPLNFQRLALTVQHTIQRGPTYSNKQSNLHNINTVFRQSKSDWWTRRLTDHAQLCSFELVYPGCMSSSGVFDQNQVSATIQGCICSDGSYVYLLSVYGLFKMGQFWKTARVAFDKKLGIDLIYDFQVLVCLKRRPAK